MKKRNKRWLVLAIIMILCLILAIVDIFFADISFIHGNEFGIVVCIMAIISSLISYFAS